MGHWRLSMGQALPVVGLAAANGRGTAVSTLQHSPRSCARLAIGIRHGNRRTAGESGLPPNWTSGPRKGVWYRDGRSGQAYQAADHQVGA
jgi:hypothetical protein